MKVTLSYLRNPRKHTALWIVILSLGGLAFGESSKLSPDLQAVGPNTNVNVIVQYYNPPTNNELDFANSVAAANGKKLGLVKAYALKTSPAYVQNLITQDPNIKYVSLDRPLKGAMNYAVPAVNADVAHNLGYDGTGIGIAVIDSGINPVWDLNVPNSKASRIVYSQNFDTTANTTSDLYGHGTHVAGIIAGNGAASLCSNCDVAFRGIAPNANIINLRVLDANGSATDSTVISAIQQAIALKNQYNIRIINLSLGRGIFESYTLDPLCQAVEQAWNAGLVVVAAAGNYGRDNSNGNYGYGTITAPGNDPYVITVGAMKTMGTATRADDLIATYSSKGPTLLDHIIKPDIVAPGNLIISELASTSATLYLNYPQNAVPISYYTTSNNQNASSSYFTLSGTSMAAPMVSGAAALLLQQNPSLAPDQVKARLMKTAYKTFPASSAYTDPSTGITYTDYYDIFTIGAGYLDVWAALNNTDLAPGTAGSALSPTAVFSSTTNQVYMSSGTSVIWGKSTTWSTSVVWGTAVIWGTSTTGQSVLWGAATACWDTTTSSGFSVIWDQHALWGHSSTSADSVLTATEK
jgi:serine protease AprX